MKYKFIEYSNLPKNKVKVVIVDYRISNECRNYLNDRGIDCIMTRKSRRLYNAISGHPDIAVCYLGKGKFIVSPNLDKEIIEKLRDYGAKVILGNSIPEYKYPFNVMYNVAIVGKYVIHNFEYTDKVLLSELKKDNYRFIDVKQGYSKCMICIVNSKSIITSDKGIAKSCKEAGIEVLLIDNERKIKLFELEYGFIGGSTGKLSDNILAFSGNFNFLSSKNEIINFLSSKKIMPLSLSACNLEDLGSIIPIIEQ